MKKSATFEHQVHRIYELLERSGAKVTWDDRILDPDNPSQRRQIDITVRRNGKLTIIECRDQRCRQDVQWVEELSGRRFSLRGDLIIGVSSSGFTSGASDKAERLGVVLRDIRHLTDQEVESWGGRVALTLYFYQYSDLDLSCCFKNESIPKLDLDAVKRDFASAPYLQSLFVEAKKLIDSLNLINGDPSGYTVDFGFHVQLDDLKLSGEDVLGVKFKGKAQLIAKEVISPAVVAYGDPKDTNFRKEVIVEKFSLGETAIIHDGDRIAIFLDLSQLKVPPLCQFRGFRVAGHQEMGHDTLEFAGLERVRIEGPIKTGICSPQPFRAHEQRVVGSSNR